MFGARISSQGITEVTEEKPKGYLAEDIAQAPSNGFASRMRMRRTSRSLCTGQQILKEWADK
jgi:hypothetical protein